MLKLSRLVVAASAAALRIPVGRRRAGAGGAERRDRACGNAAFPPRRKPRLLKATLLKTGP